jgi:hypothetical protein
MLKQTILLASLFMTAFCFSDENFEEQPLTSVCSPNGCYFIEMELGQGAFGKVYAVKDSQGQEFALKSYIPNGFGGNFATLLSDAKREFNIGQIMDHPNIIKSIDWFPGENETQFVLLELVKGKMVYATPKKSMSNTQAIRASLQLIDALKYGIENKFVYLDLHPGNVMFTDTFDTKIVDISSFFTFDELGQLFLKQKGKNMGVNPVREEKFRKFMDKHAPIFAKIKMSKNIAKEEIVKYYLMANFDAIVEMTILMLGKSDLDREIKIELFAAIKKVSWNFTEDFEDGINLPMSHYFDQLEGLLLEEISNK